MKTYALSVHIIFIILNILDNTHGLISYEYFIGLSIL
jgi:hypothetical protein